MFMDTALEKAIGLGADYPFEPLGPGECIVPRSFLQKTGVKEGDTIQLMSEMKDFINVIIDVFNTRYMPGQVLPKFSLATGYIPFDCVVKGSVNQSYGKYGKDNVDKQFILEYNEMFPYLADFFPPVIDEYPEFIEYLSTPDLMYQYASLIMLVIPGDRASYYQTSDVAKMRVNVFDFVDQLTLDLGFYPLKGFTNLLEQVATYS